MATTMGPAGTLHPPDLLQVPQLGGLAAVITHDSQGPDANSLKEHRTTKHTASKLSDIGTHFSFRSACVGILALVELFC